MKVTIYTDGSSRGNPGPGGWGVVMIINNHDKHTANSIQHIEDTKYDEVIELGGSEDHTTNNRMELRGAIEGLRHVNARHETSDMRQQRGSGLMSDVYGLKSVEICTDSEYVKKGISEWIEGWIAKGWKTSTKKPVLNQDLWEELYKEEKRLKDAGVAIAWTYVRAHVGIPLNERADVIATSCADSVIEKGATNLQLYRGPKSEYAFL